jgi:O-antigen/teichoic acid export membrane protein
VRRILENAATLLGGHAGAAVLQLAALALTARALGPDRYGALVLIQTWVLVVDRLLNFQSWQVVIRYGALALEEKEPRAFRSVVKLAFALDLLGAIAGALVAAGAIAIGARLFDWSPETERIGIAYSAVILFHLGGMPTGVLRLLDRFRWFAAQSIASAALRLALVAWAYLGEVGLTGLALAWAISDVAGNVLLFALGRIALAREGHSLLDGSIAEARTKHPDLARFALLTNLETTFRHVFREADVFLVRAFLDTGAVGLYHLIKQIASVPERLTNPLYFSVMPVMARLWAKGDRESIWRHIRKTRSVGLGIAAALVVGYLAAGSAAIELALGPEYAELYVPAAIALAGTSLWAASYAYSALLVAMGLAREKLRLTVIASLSAVLLQVVLLPRFGLIGGAVSFAVASVMWIGTAAVIVHGRTR